MLTFSALSCIQFYFLILWTSLLFPNQIKQNDDDFSFSSFRVVFLFLFHFHQIQTSLSNDMRFLLYNNVHAIPFVCFKIYLFIDIGTTSGLWFHFKSCEIDYSLYLLQNMSLKL